MLNVRMLIASAPRKKEVVMSLSSLREYLDKNDIQYGVISHSPAFTAQGIAALVHVPGQELAKSVVVKLDGELALAILPASFRIDLTSLQEETNCKRAELASERNSAMNFRSANSARCRRSEIYMA